MGLFERFPYANFHGLNLDWLIETVKSLLTRVDTLETDVAQLQQDMRAVEGRLDAAESDIDALEGRMDAAESDIDTLQNFLPTAGDPGQVLTYVSASAGASWQDAPTELPAYTSADEDKVLTVQNDGTLAWEDPSGGIPDTEAYPAGSVTVTGGSLVEANLFKWGKMVQGRIFVTPNREGGVCEITIPSDIGYISTATPIMMRLYSRTSLGSGQYSHTLKQVLKADHTFTLNSSLFPDAEVVLIEFVGLLR